MSDVTDAFLPGSFRGVPFKWFDVDGQHGVRGEEHEFPKRDTPYFEGLGRGARQFTLNVCTIGVNYAADRDALIDACEIDTPGLLMHPTQGQQMVVVLKGGCQYHESVKKLGVAYFTIVFTEGGSRANAATVSAGTQAAAANAADALLAAAQTGAADSIATSDVPSYAAAAAQGDAVSVLGMLQDLAAGAAALPLAAFAFVGAAVSAVAGVAALVAAPVALAAAIASQVCALPLVFGLATGAVRTAIVGTLDPLDPVDAVALSITQATDAPGAGVSFPDPATAIDDAYPIMLALSAIDPTLAPAIGAVAPAIVYTAPTGLTPGQQTIANNQAVLLALTRQVALAVACKLVAQTDFVSYNDAVAVRDDLAARLDAETLASGDARVRKALRALRVATVRDLSARAVQLPKLIAYVPATTMPARVIAHRIYDDPSYAADIVARNDIEHPGLLPGGVAIRILSDAA